jgi:4-aminobutyrate aminotransferase-like enzyme
MGSATAPAVAAERARRRSPALRFVRGCGVWLQDAAGRRFLDAGAADGALAWGYDAALVHEAARRAATLPALPSSCESEPGARVLRRLADRIGDAVGVPGRVLAEVDGARGVEAAIRIVAAHRGGGAVLALPGDPQSTAVARRTDGVAALLVGPVLHPAGCLLPDSGQLRGMVAEVHSTGGLIVADEAFTGMHRLGTQWGFQRHGFTPDLVVAGPALTNGLTGFSCVWAREPLADAAFVASGRRTGAGDPHSLAVVDAVLDRWDAWPDAEQRIHARSELLATELDGLAARRDLVSAVRVTGALTRLDLAGPYADRVRDLAAAPGDGPGLLLPEGAPGTLALHPPLVITAEETRTLVDLLDGALAAVSRQL